MIGPRRLLALAAVVTALGLVWWWTSSPPETGLDDASLVDCPPGGMARLRVSTREGAVAGHRVASGWQIEGEGWESQETRWLAGAFEAIAAALCGLPVLDRVENPTVPGPFGVGGDAVGIRFTEAGNGPERSLRVGRSSPTGAAVYVRFEGDTDVLVVGALLADEVDKVGRLLRRRE